MQIVVPSLEGSEPMIALLHLRDESLESWLKLNPLYCGGEPRAWMRVKHDIHMLYAVNAICSNLVIHKM